MTFLEGMQSRRSRRRRKLRKQPRLRRAKSVSVVPAPHLDVPATAKKRRRRKRWRLPLPISSIKKLLLSSRWASLLLLVISMLALVLIGQDESFYLTRIPVEGVASIPPEEIVNASGLGGAHIFSVEPTAAAKRIADLPGVISATVTLSWPNEAHISLEEDSPVLVWQQGNTTYWVSDGGTLFPARIDLPGVLHIQVEEEKLRAAATAPATGELTEPPEGAPSDEQEPLPLFVPEAVLQGALELRELRPQIEMLYYSASNGLSYQDGRGWRAYFGAGPDMAQKLVVYETLVERLVEAGATPEYVSVANLERPFFRAAGGRASVEQ